MRSKNENNERILFKKSMDTKDERISQEEEILNVILFEYEQHTVSPETIINSNNSFDTKSKARKKKIKIIMFIMNIHKI